MFACKFGPSMGITDEPCGYGWGAPFKGEWKQGSEARKTWRGDPLDVSPVPGYSGHEVPDDRRRGGNNGDASEVNKTNNTFQILTDMSTERLLK